MKNNKVIGLGLLLGLLLSFTFIFSACGNREDDYTLPSDLKGKIIGVQKGTIFEEVVKNNIESPKIKYYSNYDEELKALLNGTIDAFAIDEGSVRFMMAENPKLNYLLVNTQKDSYGFGFSKTEFGEKLTKQMNEFLYNIKVDGRLNEIDDKWFGLDKSQKVIGDIDNMPNKNGEIKLACEELNEPFAYMDRERNPLGYDIDIVYQFCLEYGYKLNVLPMSFEESINAVYNNEADCVCSCVTITDERKEKMYMSDGYFNSQVVIAVLKDPKKTTTKKYYDNIQDLKYKRLGVLAGTVYDTIAVENIEGVKLEYYMSVEDLFKSIEKGKIDGTVIDEPLARYMLNNFSDLKMLNKLITYDEYAPIFNKDSEFGKKLLSEYNEFLRQIKNNGVMDEIDNIWFGKEEKLKVVDYESLPNVNGRVRMCISTEIGKPFAYNKDGKFVGYDIDMMYRFCKENGYALSIDDVYFGDLVNLVENNTYDLAACCITINEDRKELINFSNPNYMGGLICVVKKNPNEIK